jgi:hypothetical protein
MAKTNSSKKGKPNNDALEEATVCAEHKEGNHHAVGFWNLHVLIVPDGSRFFAQCQEIDYAAQGDSLEEAQTNFEAGFVATVHHHLEMFGSIGKMLEPIPTAEWFGLLKSTEGMQFSVEHKSLHQIFKKAQGAFPPAYKGIEYAMGATHRIAEIH